MKSNGPKYRRPLIAIIGARALPHRHPICTGTGGFVSTWLQLLNSRSDYPATITNPPLPPLHSLHQGNQNMSNQHTGMCMCFETEAQIFLDLKSTNSAATQSLSKEAWSFIKFSTTKKKKKSPAKTARTIVKYCLIIHYKRKACDPQQKNSRLSQLTFNGAVQHM